MKILFFLVICLTASPPALWAQDVRGMPPAGPPGSTFQLEKSRTSIREVSQPDPHVRRGEARGLWQALIILIDFPDYRWNHTTDRNFPNSDTLYTPAHFEAMLFSRGTYRHPGSQSTYTGSMRDFFLENSYGQFDLTGVVTAWYTASQPLEYYADGRAGFGTYPRSAAGLVQEAVALADSAVDFSRFDNNGDGIVDALFVVHAGPGAEEIYTTNFPEHRKYLWSHKSSIPAVEYDGVQVRGYTLEPENGAIGVFCHEFGHALGLPDLYDTDGSSEGIGEWGLMGGGGWCHRSGDPLGTSPSHLSAWSKARLGWLMPVNVTENLADVEIPPVETEPVAYRLWRNGEVGPEYFLVENRQNIGFDAGLTRRQKDFNLPDPHGLIIYHVNQFGIQSDERRRLVDIEEASPVVLDSLVVEQLDLRRNIPEYEFLSQGNRGDNGDPFPGYLTVNETRTDFVGARSAREFGPETVPSSHDHTGAATGVSVRDIREVGVNVVADLNVTVVTDVPGPVPDTRPTVVSLAQNYPNPFNPRTRISFRVVGSHAVNVRMAVYNLRGELVKTLLAGVRGPGRYTVTWDGTDDAGRPVSAGVYLYRLQVGKSSESRKMILLK